MTEIHEGKCNICSYSVASNDKSTVAVLMHNHTKEEHTRFERLKYDVKEWIPL